ncbi:MAG: glycosyltransferase [Desulfohalobiaceae bacterium]
MNITSKSCKNPAHGEITNIVLLGEISKSNKTSHGGTGLGLIRLANALSKLVTNIEVITSHKKRLLEYSEELSSSINIKGLGALPRSLQLLKLITLFGRSQGCILIARNTKAIDFGLLIKRFMKDKICLICTLHHESVVRQEHNHRLENSKQKRFSKMAKLADGIISVSPGLHQATLARANFDIKRTCIIPNPAYHAPAIREAQSAPVSRPISNGLHLITVGRLSKEKRQDLILYALSRLIHEYKIDAYLSIIGDGSLSTELKRLAKNLDLSERVFFRGFVQNPLAYMADADIFVLSSDNEAFGYVLVEALALGLCIVSTDCPYGPRYILENGKYGMLVQCNDSRSLTNGITNCSKSKFDKSMLQERAREFTSDKIAKQYIDFINSICVL